MYLTRFAPIGRLTIASFIIAIVGVCFGLAALVMIIINAVRISRMKRGIDNHNHNESKIKASYVANKIKDEPTSSTPCNTPVFHPSTKPPYYACIFTSQHNLSDPNAIIGYRTLANEIDELAKQQEGYLGIDSSNRDTNGLGITVSYWKSSDFLQHNFWARADFTVIIMCILPELNVSMEGRNKCQRSRKMLLIALISNNTLFWKNHHTNEYSI